MTYRTVGHREEALGDPLNVQIILRITGAEGDKVSVLPYVGFKAPKEAIPAAKGDGRPSHHPNLTNRTACRGVSFIHS